MAAVWFYQGQRDETMARHVADAYQWMRREPLRSIDSTFAALAVGDSLEAEKALDAARAIAVERIENTRDEATIEGRPGLFGIGVMRWRQGDVYSRLRSDGRYTLIASKRDPDTASKGAGQVYMLDMNSMRTLELENERTRRRRLEYMGFSSDGARIFVTRQFELDVYDLTGTLVYSKQLGRTAQPLHIAVGYFSDTWILVCDSERQLWLADTDTGESSRWMERTRNVPAVLAEPNLAGDLAVIVFEDGAVMLLMVDNPKEPKLVELNTRDVTFAAFHDSTRRFVTANQAGILELWEPGSETPIAKFQQSTPAGLIRFSDDGERLVAVAEDGTVYLWEIERRILLASRRR
jgi:WD40 repeat protein